MINIKMINKEFDKFIKKYDLDKQNPKETIVNDCKKGFIDLFNIKDNELSKIQPYKQIYLNYANESLENLKNYQDLLKDIEEVKTNLFRITKISISENNKERKYYTNEKTGLYFNLDRWGNDENGIECWNNYIHKLAGHFHLEYLKVIRDKSNTVKEPYYCIKYYQPFFNKHITLNNVTKQELVKHITSNCLFNNESDVKTIITDVCLEHPQLINYEETVLHEGYFLESESNGELIKDENGKYILLENSIYQDEPEPTKEQVKEAIKLINILIRENSIINDCKYVLFGFHSPFHWCIKQLGYANNNIKAILSYGERNTGKTEFLLFLKWLYENPLDYNTSADSLSSMVNMLGNTTFFTLFDDSHNLLTQKGVKGSLKKGIQGKNYRTVSDQNDFTKNQQYPGLSTPAFTFNGTYDLKDGLIRRTEPIHYTSVMKEPEDKTNDFNKEYKPLSPSSKLKPLKYLGIVFKNKIKSYLEEGADELYNINSLTIKILKEISEEAGEPFKEDLLKEQPRQEELDEDRGLILRNGLNKSFRHNKKINSKYNGYTIEDFIYCADNKVFDWLHYQPKNELFIIDKTNFIKHCENLTKTTLDWDLIKEFLKLIEVEDIQEEIKENYKGEYDSLNWSETAEGWSWSSCNIETVKQCKVSGKNLRNCFKIYMYDLSDVIFNISLITDQEYGEKRIYDY